MGGANPGRLEFNKSTMSQNRPSWQDTFCLNHEEIVIPAADPRNTDRFR
jgi:hypothetical protein